MDEKLDVLVITQFFPPESMGGAHRWEKLASNLDEGVRPHILCTQPTFPFGEFERLWRPIEQQTRSGVPVTRLFTYQPKSDTILGRILNYGIFSLLSTLYVLFTFWRYDCIVTMSAPHTTFFPGLIGKLTGRRWVIDIFDLWIDNAADLGYVKEKSIFYLLVSSLEHIAFAKADTVFAITDTMAEYYENKYPKLDFDIRVVPFGIDTKSFSPNVESTKSTDIIYTGNLGNGQAFVPFLKGFARLEGDPELTMVGDGERREELEALLKKLGVDEQVTFEGYVPREEIPRFLAGAKISLVPLKTEYQLDYARPTKLLETMAVGTPYVASAVWEIAELSQEYETGIAVENEVEIIYKAMDSLLANYKVRNKMASNEIEVVKLQHDWEDIGKKVSAALQEREVI